MEAASIRSIPYRVTDRRPGDADISIADPSQALKRLGWRTKRSLEDICRDGWAWQKANQNGYSNTGHKVLITICAAGVAVDVCASA